MKNAVVWSEIAVADLKRATAFYEKLLDGRPSPASTRRSSARPPRARRC